MAYVPTGNGARSITVNMARLSGQPVQARWYNPASGAFTAVSGSPLPNTGSRSLTTPGNNGAGASDWALVLEAP